MGEERFGIIDEAVRRAHYGLAITRWEPGERLPRFEWVNEVVVARSKVPIAELLDRPAAFFELGSNADAAELIRDRLERHDPTPFELEFTARDGSTYWLECVVSLLERLPDGTLRFVIATNPIGHHKERERFRALLAATIDSEQDGVFIVRLRGHNPLSPPVLYVNPAFSRITGYTSDDLAIGLYPRLFGAATDRTLVSERAQAVLSGQAVITEIELYRKDGSRFWAEVCAHPLESPAVHCALSIRDVTGRRRSQEMVSLLSEAVSQASDFMIVTDDAPSGKGGPRIIYVNRSFLDATGYAEEELVDKHSEMIYSPNNLPSLMTSIRDAIDAGQPNYREVLAARKDGSEFWIEFVDRPFVTRFERRLRLMVGRDITIRRRAANQLSLLFAAMEQASTPIVLYEPNDAGELTVSFENALAAQREYYHLLELWNREGDAERSIRERLERGETVTFAYERLGATIELEARAIRNASRLEAVLTEERAVM